MTDSQKLARILTILRAAVANGDARARVLADVEAVAHERDEVRRDRIERINKKYKGEARMMETCKPGDYTCDECGDAEAATVVLMAESEDGSRWFCAACLHAALELLDPAKGEVTP